MQCARVNPRVCVFQREGEKVGDAHFHHSYSPSFREAAFLFIGVCMFVIGKVVHGGLDLTL